MENLTSIKTSFFTVIGVIGSIITGLLGGWDTALQTLLIFMAIDYIMGIIVAGVFHKSEKTETGALQSNVGWRGICKKGVTLLFILIGAQLDKMMGLDSIRYGLIIAFSTNELVSIVENGGLMGIPIPSLLTNAIDILKKKEGIPNEVR